MKECGILKLENYLHIWAETLFCEVQNGYDDSSQQ